MFLKKRETSTRITVFCIVEGLLALESIPPPAAAFFDTSLGFVAHEAGLRSQSVSTNTKHLYGTGSDWTGKLDGWEQELWRNSSGRTDSSRENSDGFR